MPQESNLQGRPVYVVDGCRTPFLKARGLGPFSAADLAVAAGKVLLNRQPFAPKDLDEVILGSVMSGADEANIARLVALRLGCGERMPAYTVMRNCASGLQALDDAAKDIASGRCDLVLAGGSEAMSRAPLLFNEKMADWLSKWNLAKSPSQRFALLGKFRPSYFSPVLALLKGLTDPLVGLNMGQTAEKIAFEQQISREQMDQFALESHQHLDKAYKQGWMSEVIPLVLPDGRLCSADDGLRADTTLEKLAKLQPIFDKKYGMVTAGNSSQVSDGACLLLLASAEKVKEYQLPVLGRIVDIEWAALDPARMGLGPIFAATPLLERQHLTPDEIDFWEINEAFAAQVLACLAAWKDPTFCQQELGLKKAMGAIDNTKINVDGGAVAIGHPVGASGARIVLHLLEILKRNHAQRGLASICIGGGQGGAILLERSSS